MPIYIKYNDRLKNKEEVVKFLPDIVMFLEKELNKQ
jgi:hypothetical protein